MMAGESAREQARRQREKAARLERSAALWEQGADGEEATAAALGVLPADSWTVFHDVRWPGRKLANIDHVAVGPGGIFVIDSKNWTGRLEVRDGVLRQNGYSREQSVASAADAAIAVSLLAPYVQSGLAVPVLCFTRDEPIAGWARDVMVCSSATIAEMLTTRPQVLDATQRQQVCLGLDLSLARAGQARGASHPRTPAGWGPWAPSPSVDRSPGGAAHSASQPRAAGTRRQARRGPRRPGPGARLLRLVVAGAFLMYVLGSGVLPAAGQWFGERFAEQLVSEPADPQPAPADEQRRKPAKENRGRTGQR